MKTIEQAAKKYVEDRYSTANIAFQKVARFAFTEGVKWSEKWIKLSEHKPPTGSAVFFCRDEEFETVEVGFIGSKNVYEDKDTTNTSYEYIKGHYGFETLHYEPTHWRPIIRI